MLTSPHIEFLRTIALDSALQTVKWIAAKFPFVRATSELRHVEWLEKRKVQSYSHIINIAHDRIIEVLKYRYPIFAWKKISNFRLISFEFEGKVVTYFFFWHWNEPESVAQTKLWASNFPKSFRSKRRAISVNALIGKSDRWRSVTGLCWHVQATVQ